jgi:hypothetical protein
MADTATRGEGGGRLADAFQDYLEARAEHAINGLGQKIGDAATKLAEDPAGLVGKLTGGANPTGALLKLGAGQLKKKTVGGLKEKLGGLMGGGKGGKGRSGGGQRSVTITEDIDVGVPCRVAYDQWTQFHEFSTWAKGVKSVDRADDTTSNWTAKIFWSTRNWQGKVTEQVPDRRIAWSTEGAKGTTKGVVTFHPLADDLTRVLLVIQYFPSGLFEKTGNIWRAQGRRARLDLKLYRRFVMMRGEATGSWRGEIQDGEVVRSHEDAAEAEEQQRKPEDDEAAYEGEDYDETDEDEADEDETDEDAEDYPEDEEDVDEEELEDEELPEEEYEDEGAR